MGIEEQIRREIAGALGQLVRAGELPAEVLNVGYKLEPPKRPEHGELASNVALAIQKIAGKPPRAVAEALAKALAASTVIRAAEVAGPGFINLRLGAEAYHRVLGEVLAAGESYGRAPSAIKGRVLVEFVSANPTGPLLISHGRNAVLGDAVARLLEATGHHVSREYYINDFGNQIRLLAESVRALQAGQPPPEGGYGGAYVGELGRWIARHLPDDPVVLGRLCVTCMLDGLPGSSELPGIRRTLGYLGIEFDNWFSEESLYRCGRVDAALAQLKELGRLEERDGALFFKSADAEVDQDRVVRKSDGAFTYFASDIAYHVDKLGRGYQKLIVVLGADHHGYEARVRGAIDALGLPSERFEVLFFQLVHLLRDGKPYKMGKRLGNLITITEIAEEIDQAVGRVGACADALRYFYLSRRSDSPIEIDIELAKKSTLDNPVFYLQMGYARLCSILRRAKEVFDLEVPPYAPALAARIQHPDELGILAHLGRFASVIADAAEGREPHRLIFYIKELSEKFQSYFTRLKAEGDAILPLGSQMTEVGWQARWDQDKTLARLLWIEAIRCVYGAGLRLLGLTALSRMDPLQDRPEPAAGELTEQEGT
jgi:arginyl-tRNA synthetase